MLLLFICILFNSYISVIFKLFDRFGIRVLQAIVLNYFICVLTASVVMGRPAVTMDVIQTPWFGTAIAIGLAFIVTFNLFAQTVQKYGVVTASIFQKMSLIAPTIGGILIFSESYSLLKIIGIVLAIASIFVISTADKKKTEEEVKPNDKLTNKWIWIFPIGTFIGSCIIDSGLFLVNKTGLANSNDIDFIATLFFFAGCFGVLFAIYDLVINKTGFRWKDIIAAFALGIPNFFSIWLLMKVLSQGMDASVVFPINNVGILLTTAFLGYLFFAEKFNKKKLLGFILAVSAIIMIAMATH